MTHIGLSSTTIVAAALLSACAQQHAPAAVAGNPDAATSAQARKNPPVLDACALLTQADADAVLGNEGKLTEHAADDRFASHCSYESADATSGFNAIGIQIGFSADAQAAMTEFEIKRGLYSNYTIYRFELLPGIGDAAFLAVSKTPDEFKTAQMSSLIAHQQLLMAIKNSKAIHITTSYFGAEKSTAAIQTLARKLAAQL
jgi:hypothetical protein